MYLMAAVNMEEKKRHLLKQPYLRRLESEKKLTKQMQCRTEQEALDYIFEGM